MRRFLPLVFCLVFIVGCGQSYEDALQTLNNEIALLERMEKERKQTIAQYKAQIAEIEELEKESTEFGIQSARIGVQNAKLKTGQRTEKIVKLLELRHKVHLSKLQPIEKEIAEQTKRVQDAKLTCDKLKQS